MKSNYKVGIIGATGMVGQRFITLLHDHPWYTIEVLAASPRSAGKPYKDAVGAKWAMKEGIPESVADMVVMDATGDVEKIASMVDFVFCAVDMKKDEIKALEERYAKAECPVVSNNSAHRHTPDVPMIIPEINPQHIEIIPSQRKRLGTKRGFVAVKSNCSLQSYLPAMAVINQKYPIDHALVTTYQAISGAGKTFETWPEMVDNLIPYLGGDFRHVTYISARLLDRDNILYFRKLFKRIDCEAHTRTRRYVIENHGYFNRVRDSRKVRDKSVLRGFVVVRRYGQNTVRAQFFGFLCKLYRVTRIVRACTRNYGYTPVYLFNGVLDSRQMLLVGHRRGFAGSAADNNCVRTVFNVKLNKPAKLVIIRLLTVERRYDCNARPCER